MMKLLDQLCEHATRKLAQHKPRQELLVGIAVVFSLASLPTQAEASASGEKQYQQCAACHLPSGTGAPGLFPPLTKRLGAIAERPEGRDYLVMVTQAGLMGPISIEGVTYQSIMPPQGLSLGNEGIASVLNYILRRFNADTLGTEWQAFTAEEVARITSKYATANSQDVYKLRQSVFPRAN